MFQPWTLTTPDRGYIDYFYIAYLLNPSHPFFLPSDVRPGDAYHSCPATPVINFRPVSARDHPPTRASPVSVPEYRKTFAHLPLTYPFQSLTPPPLPLPLHKFRIPVATAPFLPPKSLLTWNSVIVQLPHFVTMAPGAPPPLVARLLCTYTEDGP